MSGFPDLAQLAVDQAFAAFGVPAEYHVADGPANPLSVTIIPTEPDETLAGFGDTRHRARQALFKVRKSEVDVPTKGDTLLVDDRSFNVVDVEIRDRLRLVWILDCDPT